MTLRAIWAQARSGVIGRDGDLPWHLPEDLAHFKEQTFGAPVVMGRKTWESFPERYRPLPGRTNIVVTRDESYDAAGASVVHDLDAGIDAALAEGDAWVIGGAQIFERAMDRLDELVVTEIDLEVAGDTNAPELGPEWRVASTDPDEGWHTSRTGTRYRFVTYARAA